MLRITSITTGAAVTLRLEGKLLGPWVDELRGHVSGAPVRRLDLSSLSFVDPAGARLLDGLRRGGVELVNASNFITQLLDSESK